MTEGAEKAAGPGETDKITEQLAVPDSLSNDTLARAVRGLWYHQPSRQAAPALAACRSPSAA
jgi:hypothetical protein